MDSGEKRLKFCQFGGSCQTDGVEEIPASCFSAKCIVKLDTATAGGALALDGSGNLYLLVNEHVSLIPRGCASPACVTTLPGSFGGTLAVDASGNLYTTTSIQAAKSFAKIDRVSPPTLIFASASGSEASITMQNIGTESLFLPVPLSGANPSISGDFTLDSSNDNACPEVTNDSDAPGTLAAGAGCDLEVTFTPQESSVFSIGSLVLTDNSLNATAPRYAKQTLFLAAGANPPVGAMGEPMDATSRSSLVAQSDNILVSGWAADPQDGAPVSKVTVLIDGSAVGNATLGIPRPDVVIAHNDNFAWYRSGWTLTVPASNFSTGGHHASAVIFDSVGLSTQLDLPGVLFHVSRTSGGIAFGSLDGAVDATTRSTTVAQSDDLKVSGWAAYPNGAEANPVSILFDGKTEGNATLGLPSSGVAAHLNNANYANSGWLFTMPAGSLSLGSHEVTAEAVGLPLGQKTITVSSTPVYGPPFGSLDEAVDAATGSNVVSQSDTLQVEGWAADVHDGAPVHQVSILIDGTAVGNATLGITRPDVAAKKGSVYLNSGWTFTMAASSLPTGAHTVTAVATDSLDFSKQL